MIEQAPPGLLQLALDPEPSGPPTALRSAARAWSAVLPGATHHLVLQDDAVLSARFFDIVQDAVSAAPHVGIAFYAHWNSRNGAAVRLGALADARWVSVTREYIPTVALALPADVAEGFADYARCEGAGWPDDVVMQRYLTAVGVQAYLTVPNIVEHDDLPSVARNDYHGLRRAACFADLPADVDLDMDLDMDVVPFFKHGTAQCAVRVGRHRRWITVDGERYCSRAGLDLAECQKGLHEISAASKDIRTLVDRVRPKALEAFWLTANLMGFVHGGRLASPDTATGRGPSSPLVDEALSTLGPGGLCGELSAATLIELRPELSEFARLGVALGTALRAEHTSRQRPPIATAGAARSAERMVKVVLTGNDGPLARYLAQDLADRGYDVGLSTTDRGDDYPGADYPGADYPGVTPIPKGVLASDDLDGALDGVDAVVYLGDPDAADPAADSAGATAAVRRARARAVLELATAAAVSHFIYVSPHAEPGHLEPSTFGRPSTTVLRLGVPYGPGVAGDSLMADFVERALLAQPLLVESSMDRPVQYVYVRDVAQAVDRVLRLRQEGVFDISDEKLVTTFELADAVARVIRPVRIHLAARPEPHAGVRLMTIDRARAELGWRPTVDLEEGLRAFAQWLAYEAEPTGAPAGN